MRAFFKKRCLPNLSLTRVLTFGAAGSLYILYLAATIHLFMAMQATPAPHVMTATQELPQSDFARFWYAGKILFIQSAAHFGYQIEPSPWFKSTFQADILSPSAPPAIAWLYPPTMGLLAIAFSFAPLGLSYWLWQIGSLVCAGFLLRYAGLPWLVIVAGLGSPAGLHNFIGGQNGALTGGLLVAALLLFDKHPKRGGFVAGLLCIKPQMMFALPAILLRKSRLTALLTCILTAAGIAALSLLIEGWPAWQYFFSVAQPNSMRLLALPFAQKFPVAGVTVFVMARSLHASVAEALCVQAVSAVLSLLLVWQSWRRRAGGDPVPRMALTVCLTLLITPYGYSYDLVAFSIAMAALFARASNLEQAVIALLWLFGGYTITFVNLTGIIIMPLATATGAWLAWRQIKLLETAA